MFLVLTRNFPPEVGGMQNLMWGLTTSLSKLDMVKVFADYHENSNIFDEKVSFSVERVLLRKASSKASKLNTSISKPSGNVHGDTLLT